MNTSPEEPTCPLPQSRHETVQLAHGGGGLLMHQLIDGIFLAAFGADRAPHDAATLDVEGQRLAFTTDSYVVHPLVFPGGDIGSLAVNGTVNDLAMAGARPLYLSAGFIIEEGLPLSTLRRVVATMRDAAAAAGVRIVTGDTKVVDRGKGDGLFINTAGVGILEHDEPVHPTSVAAGDQILLSGDVGRHGMAIMARREGLEFESTIESDCAPLNHMVRALIEEKVTLHCLRDLTRGGLATALVEIARQARRHLRMDAVAVPVEQQVRGACEILGLDPFYVANEGRMVAFVPEADADRALEIMRRDPAGTGACRIGSVTGDTPGQVTVASEIGTVRILDMLSGEQLPRIC